VSFGFGRNELSIPEAILVDFEGSKHAFERVTNRGEEDRPIRRAKTTDASAVEVLMMTPEGKLVALDGASDAANAKRKDTLKDVRERLDQVKHKKSGTEGGPKKPFGGGGPSGSGT
jgi:hypothetical protein